MNLSVKIDGLDRLRSSSQNVRDSVERELKAALKSSGERVRGEAIKSILEGNKSGVLYRRGSVTHKASAAGEAPANDTGRLASSIISIQNESEALVIAGRGSVKYARFLEFGTERMAERPFMIPALEKSKKWIIERLNKAVRDGAIKASKK